MAPSDPSSAPHGDPPMTAKVLIVPSLHTNNSPVFPSHNTMAPSGITTGPSGNPRFEASSVPCTARILFQGLYPGNWYDSIPSLIDPRGTGSLQGLRPHRRGGSSA